MANKWKLCKEKNSKGNTLFIIRRWNGSRPERLPVKKYELIRNNQTELENLVVRLNSELPQDKSRRIVELRHAFISPELLESYRKLLLVQSPTVEKAQYEYYCIVNYFLDFFINKMMLTNPVAWHVNHKSSWAEYLLSNQVPKSAYAKKFIVNSANKFMTHIHELRPTEVPPLKFVPISKAKYKEIEANRELDGHVKERKYIKDPDMDKIRRSAPKTIKAFIELAHHYGLRRSEALGLKLEDIRKGYLSVTRQLVSHNLFKTSYKPLKGREARKVPHWSSEPVRTLQWLIDSQNHTVHPDTLSDRWAKLMTQLDMNYDFHDLRHTWVTRMMRLQNHRDVQLAAGHKSIETTMIYLHDDRDMDDELFKAS